MTTTPPLLLIYPSSILTSFSFPPLTQPPHSHLSWTSVSSIFLSSLPFPFSSHVPPYFLYSHLLSQPSNHFSLLSLIPTTPPPLPIDPFPLLTSLSHHIPTSPLPPLHPLFHPLVSSLISFMPIQ
jgi:hypothetical protein